VLWRCLRDNAGPAHPTSGTLAFQPELDGLWIGVTSEQQKSPKNPTPLKGHGAISYDSSNKMFVAVGYDNLGGYGIQTSVAAIDNAIYTGSFLLNGTEI
jgi:hypothetical protein